MKPSTFILALVTLYSATSAVAICDLIRECSDGNYYQCYCP